MGLEDLLNKKVATKNEEEAAKVAEHKAAAEAEEAQKQAEEEAQKQAAEESRIDGLQQSISDIDTKTEQMQSLLAELKQAHEQAATLVGGAKEERQKLTKATAKVNELFTNDQFRELLAEEGISSLDDLLQAEGYSEQEEVTAVKELRESDTEKRNTAVEQIHTRRQATREANQAILAERPGAERLPYKDVVVALEEIIQGLGSERKKLYNQTPEGQEAIKKELLAKVKERHNHVFNYGSGGAKSGRNSRDRRWISRGQVEGSEYNTVEGDDIRDSKEYGMEAGRTAVKDYYAQVIDEELAEGLEKELRSPEGKAKQKAELPRLAALLKERISDKVDADWSEKELAIFKNTGESSQILKEVNNILRNRQLAERLNPSLAVAISELQEQMTQQVRCENGNIELAYIQNYDFRKLKEDIESLREEIQKVNTKIKSIDESASSEGNGFLGGKRREREQAKTALDTQKQNLERALQNLEAEYDPIVTMNNKIGGDLGQWIREAKENSLELPQGSVSLQELVDNIKGQLNLRLNAQLTPEQSQTIEQHNALVSKRDQTAQQYNDKWKDDKAIEQRMY